MPELPEVETVRRVLNGLLSGSRIEGVQLSGRHQPYDQSAEEFRKHLLKQRICRADRRGKYLLINLRRSRALMIHLGMSGRIFVFHNTPGSVRPVEKEKHVHLTVHLSRKLKMVFQDPRKFGRFAVWDQNQLRSLDSRLGPEPLSSDFSCRDFISMLNNRKAGIKSLLMNQNFIAGIGNIYADESLFRARISPWIPGKFLNCERSEKLYRALRKVLCEAVNKRGTSISDFQDPLTRKGSFQFRLQVYAREGKPCPECGTSIRKAFIAQRGTHWCPSCQK